MFLIANDEKYSTADQSLLLVSTNTINGNDILGQYKSTQMIYETKDTTTTVSHQMITNIKVYDDFIIFEQMFPNDITINNNSSTRLSSDDIITSFPSFVINDDDDVKKGYAHYVSWYYQDVPDSNRRKTLVAPGFLTPTFGEWSSTTQLAGGVGGTG